ncbi:MAG: XisI protein [Oscillatoriales cyanobacterium]|uniref:XisI protein n=1 Tax=unclassified Microcoleus TaxID=2642155 RepID=UPI001D7F6A9C|nr:MULTISPECIES: XisI protein [unclassified Microcoleus]MCC3569803.1 XisI protein [Microcoleus sp. PH2017_31_RDM_U_A]MCC3582138.1 XisI protein [Microcoleus sp. PH2017_32_RDM_D_A]MCC3619998.1 XisI protein [Microcoleus sp. PH2017_38_RDM_U_B]TAE08808.1 MAG: XisI protein [Oscillatoriales cyanobacterium]
MEKVNYKELIQTILTQHSGNDLDTETEVQLLFDTERDHYHVVHLGWDEQQRVYGCVIHVDIKDSKIWIQRDRTETGIANELAAAGVPKENIVLAFKLPYLRQFTEFAIG